MTRFLFILCFATTVFSAFGQTSDTSFVSFWTAFHKDIIAKDYKALSAKTKFPLKAKGQLDYDSVDKYSEKDFESLFSKFLSQEVHTDGSTRYDYLKKRKITPGDDKEPIKWVRIENMVFEKLKGKWLLTLIYDGHSKY